MNRYFYILETDGFGNKQVRMECNVHGNQNEGFWCNEWVGCIMSIDIAQTLLKSGKFQSTLDEIVRYSEDLTEDEASAVCELYFDGISAGEELNITDITPETPCGDYHFDAE